MKFKILLAFIACSVMVLSCDSPFTAGYAPGIVEIVCPHVSLQYTNQLGEEIDALIHGYGDHTTLGSLENGMTSNHVCENVVLGYSEEALTLNFKVVVGRDTFGSGYGWCGTGLMDFTTGDYEILIKEVHKGQQSKWNGVSYEVLLR